jgi:hypothetical protein
MLDIGAAGRLLVAGDLERVLPLENAEAMRAANPVKNGVWRPDEKLTQTRRAEMARVIRLHGPVSVIVLGGSHDLFPHLYEDTEYLQVTVKEYPGP